MDVLITAIENALRIEVIVTMIIGVGAAIIIGALPGLTATMGVALILPVTFGMDPVSGLLLLVSVYFGSIYAGSIPAILLNTPGTPASAATAIDGYPLSLQGKAHKALMLSIIASVIGGIFSIIVLMLVAPQLAQFALKFSSPESFALALFGLSIITSISSQSLIKGIIVAAIGLMVATVGQDPTDGFPRYAFGNVYLMGGIPFIPILIGMFALAEAFRMMEHSLKNDDVLKNLKNTMRNVTLKWLEFKGLIVTILRSSGIGTFIGMIPGAGPDIAAYVAYNEARRFSKNKQQFGNGAMEGVAAAEAANNAASGGAFIPLLSLGIPGDAVTAVMLGALMIQGLRPGPLLFEQSADIVYTLFAGMLIALLIVLCYGLLGMRLFVKVLHVSPVILSPIILMLCVIGSYALGNNFYDVWVMFISGIVGFFLIRYGFPVSPIILALILGPLMEVNLRRTLVSHGTIEVVFTRPISATLLILAIITLLSPFVAQFVSKWKKNRTSST